jgi:hypothetical protein
VILIWIGVYPEPMLKAIHIAIGSLL